MAGAVAGALLLRAVRPSPLLVTLAGALQASPVAGALLGAHAHGAVLPTPPEAAKAALLAHPVGAARILAVALLTTPTGLTGAAKVSAAAMCAAPRTEGAAAIGALPAVITITRAIVDAHPAPSAIPGAMPVLAGSPIVRVITVTAHTQTKAITGAV